MSELTKLRDRVVAFFSSFGLAAILLVFLLVLTWVGTLAQKEKDIHLVTQEYFGQPFVVHTFPDVVLPVIDRPLAIPLPGGVLILALLFINLLVGGIVRLRKRRSRAGILIVHVGMAFLLMAGLVEFLSKDDGYVALYEGEKAAHFESFHDWEISIGEEVDGGRVREHVIPVAEFADVGPREQRFFADGLPFALAVSGYEANAAVRRDTGPDSVKGFALEAGKVHAELEQNRPGVRIALIDNAGGHRRAEILRGRVGISTTDRWPLVVNHTGRRFAIELRRRRLPLPFEVELKDAVGEQHPGSGTPRNFESDVLVGAGDDIRPAKIWMNNPLRRDGFTLYQTKFRAEPDGVNWSLFQTVRNPSDQWPKWACYIIALGLVLHFGARLANYVKSEARKLA